MVHEMHSIQSGADMDSISSEETSSSSYISHTMCQWRSLLLAAFSACFAHLRLCLQEMKRRLALFTLLSSSCQFYVRYSVIRAAVLVILFSLVLMIHTTPDSSSTQATFVWTMPNSFKALLVFVWMKVLMLWITDNFLRSRSRGCKRRNTFPELVDKNVQTVKIECQDQSTCQCFAPQDECNDHLAECRIDNSAFAAAMQHSQKQDARRAADSDIHMSELSKESPVQLPCDQSSSTEVLTATPGNDAVITEQDPPIDLDTERNPIDQPNSPDLAVKKDVASFEKSPRRVNVYKTKHGGKICSRFVKESLEIAQLMQENLELNKEELQTLEQKLAMLEEPEGETTTKNRLTKDWTSLHFTPQIQEQVYMCGGPGDGLQDDMWNERSRLASFAMYPLVPSSGVWVMQLAEAGFYCTDKSSSLLRCAFCNVEVEIGKFKGRIPQEVHRAMSPSCCLVKGEAPNKSMEEQRQTASLQFIQDFFSPGASVAPFMGDQSHKHGPSQSLDSGRQEKLGGVAVQSKHSSSSQMTSSGSPPESSEAHHHRLASAATSVSHTSQTEGDRQGSGTSQMPPSTTCPGGAHSAVFPSISPTSALAPSTGTERRNTTDGLSSSEQPSEQLGSQTRDRPPSVEPPSQLGSQTSESAPAQIASNVSTTQGTEATPTHQTARPAERNHERSTPGSGSDTEAAATAAASSQSSQTTTTNESVREVVTYAQLGIYTQEPKRRDFAIAASRIRTFANWSHSATHPPEEMAEAGFYYVGVEDLVRCFYCKGGLKSWSRSLRPWVEHARFYPHCAFVGQVKGQEFIEVVQHLKQRHEDISDAEIEEELKKRQSDMSRKGATLGNGSTETKKEMERNLQGAYGGTKDDAAARTAMPEEKLDDQAEETLEKAADELESQNQEIKNERICKICQVADVSILFLPCGHLVSCSQCAPALRTCAVCRQRVKGRVRVLEDKSYEQTEDNSHEESEDKQHEQSEDKDEQSEDQRHKPQHRKSDTDPGQPRLANA